MDDLTHISDASGPTQNVAERNDAGPEEFLHGRSPGYFRECFAIGW
jgi:hypothetical protein